MTFVWAVVRKVRLVASLLDVDLPQALNTKTLTNPTTETTIFFISIRLLKISKNKTGLR